MRQMPVPLTAEPLRWDQTVEGGPAVGGQRRKKGCRVTPKGGAPVGGLTPTERAGLEEIFERMLQSAPSDLTDQLPAVGVEVWASQMWSIWAESELVGMDAIKVFAGGLINYAAKRETPGALRVLRALGAVAPAPYGPKARRAADRLAAEGMPEPEWGPAIGMWVPAVAWLSFDPVDDDGVSVMVGFEGAGAASTVGVYVDHNLNGMAKDAFVVPAPIDEVLARLRESEGGDDDLAFREITLAEAAARWREALAMTDMYIDPPSTEDFDHLRALVAARLTTMPRRGEVPKPAEVGAGEREELLSAFLDSDETIGLWGPEDDEKGTVGELADYILTFSLDYVVGTPLRFSTVMMEMFCLDWAPRKIAMDVDAFTLLPDVLAAWTRFVGRRRGLPETSIGETVKMAYEHAPEMIELSQDSEIWGPAKTIALAIEQRSIDISDQAALDDFVDEVNRKGGIDALAESLASSVAPKR